MVVYLPTLEMSTTPISVGAFFTPRRLVTTAAVLASAYVVSPIVDAIEQVASRGGASDKARILTQVLVTGSLVLTAQVLVDHYIAE